MPRFWGRPLRKPCFPAFSRSPCPSLAVSAPASIKADVADSERALIPLEHIAYAMVDQGTGTQIARKDVPELLDREIAAYRTKTGDNDRRVYGTLTEFRGDRPEHLFNRLAQFDRAGLCQLTGDTFRFTHQSICEYLAACRLMRLSFDEIRDCAYWKSWDESFHLLLLFGESTRFSVGKPCGELIGMDGYDLIADCLNRSEDLRWEFVEKALGAVVHDLSRPLEIRKHALRLIARIDHTGIGLETVNKYLRDLLSQDQYVALWVETVWCLIAPRAASGSLSLQRPAHPRRTDRPLVKHCADPRHIAVGTGGDG